MKLQIKLKTCKWLIALQYYKQTVERERIADIEYQVKDINDGRGKAAKQEKWMDKWSCKSFHRGKWMNERTNEWMNEWMNARISELMNVLIISNGINKCVNRWFDSLKIYEWFNDSINEVSI